ncbi:chromatin target of PRMT1 protein-like [Micropterus dolomieu]|uniref:chromatin target of PRMT1 protein-like n=1 Tax=Micropterus dolomieu TaxID=147949 RepID=UPI001E8EE439|nr:chromatin target of PRMT1 protein-like [Micropterus dolomieu]
MTEFLLNLESQTNRKQMDSSKPDSFFLRSTSVLSLNERFSKVPVKQPAPSRTVTFDPVRLQQSGVCDAQPAVLLLERPTASLLSLQTRGSSVKQRPRRRRSVWTRLGWQSEARRLSAAAPRGFWSFRNKFRWRARFSSTYRRWRDLRSRPGQRRLLMRRSIQRVAAGQTRPSLHPQRSGATGSRGRGLRKAYVPTKKQLDAQLDEYMSRSRSRLDAQLDEYMSTSKRRLDAQLDEYMLMAGQVEGAEPLWD